MDVPELPAPGADGHCQGHLPPFMFPGSTLQRALIVAADATRRKYLVEWHHKRGYVATDCSNPVAATAMLRDGRERFNLVVLDAFPSCVGSMELLKCAISEMRLCVYGVSKVGYFWGPLDVEDLKTVGQTMRQTLNKSRLSEPTPHDQSNSMSTTTRIVSCSERSVTKRSKSQSSDTESQEVEQDDEHDHEQRQRPKKARLVWTEELHQKFEDAYNKLLPGDAVPKKILKLMNDATLTRENIASHLQKYRLTLNMKQLELHPPHLRGIATPPRASIMSPNKSEKQEIYMEDQVAQAVYMDNEFNAKSVILAPMINNIIQNNHPELHVQVFDAVNMNKECIAPMVDPEDEPTRRCVAAKEIYTGDQMRHQRGNDGGFQEDFNQTIDQTLNKDPGASWEHEYLFGVD